MKTKLFNNTELNSVSGKKLMTEQEWTEQFFKYTLSYNSSNREEDIKQMARMFVWMLKKTGVEYSSYEQMEQDGVPLLIQHYWFNK